MSQKKSFRALGFESEETTKIVEKLDLLLCNLQVHYQKLRNFHWNVVGPDFFDLHDIFEQEYNFVKEEIDQIAERIRVFGKHPKSNLQEYLDLSEIKEASFDLNSTEMVKEIIADFETLLSL